MGALEEFDHILLDLKRAAAQDNPRTVKQLYGELQAAYTSVAASAASVEEKRSRHAALQESYLSTVDVPAPKGWFFLGVPIAVFIICEFALASSTNWIRWSARGACFALALFVIVMNVLRQRMLTLESKVRNEVGWLSHQMRGLEKALHALDKDFMVILLILFTTALIVSQAPSVLPGLASGPARDLPRIVSAMPQEGGAVSQIVLECSFSAVRGVSRAVIHEDSSGAMRAREQTFSRAPREASVRVALPGVHEVIWWCEAWDAADQQVAIAPRTARRTPKVSITSPEPPPVEYSGSVPLEVDTEASQCSVVVDGSSASLSGLEGCSGMVSLPPGLHEITVYAVFDDGIFEDTRAVLVR